MPARSSRFPVLEFSELIIRLGAAVLVGCAIGLDREVQGKPTGVRTLGLVALGSALAVMASTDFAANADLHDGSTSRAIQGTLTGIGFLGAGVILKDNSSGHIQGLTTAASIWVTALHGARLRAGSLEGSRGRHGPDRPSSHGWWSHRQSGP